jgi:hypothetical protein
VTNLDFVEFLLEKGADQKKKNAKVIAGQTPLMLLPPYAPGAAKFLLNWHHGRQYHRSIWRSFLVKGSLA